MFCDDISDFWGAKVDIPVPYTYMISLPIVDERCICADTQTLHLCLLNPTFFFPITVYINIINSELQAVAASLDLLPNLKVALQGK